MLENHLSKRLKRGCHVLSSLASAVVAEASFSPSFAFPLKLDACGSAASRFVYPPSNTGAVGASLRRAKLSTALQLLLCPLISVKSFFSSSEKVSKLNVSLHEQQSPKGHPRRHHLSSVELLICAVVLACMASATAAAATSVTVNPTTGDDSQCRQNASVSCRTIANAVEMAGARYLKLSAGIYNEPTISISNMFSLVITGVPNDTVFDCSRRQGTSIGAAFIITNSTIVITGVTFQNCSNPSSDGGAVSASDSSLVVSLCSFTACSAASGGAVSVTGLSSGRFLVIQNSTFTRNLATGGDSGCPEDLSRPCSTWGGAISAVEIFNVSISGCTMTDNNARAFLPPSTSLLARESSNSVAGGGCLSVLFRGNASGSAVHISGNSFVGCAVYVSGTASIRVGNGECVLLLIVYLL
jgi:hypothetical protein